MRHMRTLAKSVAFVAMVLTVTGCSAQRTEFDTSDFKFKSSSITFDKKGSKTQVSITSFKFTPVDKKKYCDVQIYSVVDSNNDGDFDDPGDKRTLIYSGVGAFENFSQDNVALFVPGGAERATLEVTGVLCDAKKNAKRKVLLTAMVTSNGITPNALNPRPGYDGIAVGGGTDNPHFVEFRRERGMNSRLMLLVGDSRGATTPLSSVYRRYGISNKKDFLGALIFINDQLADIIIGEGMRALSKLNGPIKKCQILTFDNAFRLVGNWTFEDILL